MRPYLLLAVIGMAAVSFAQRSPNWKITQSKDARHWTVHCFDTPHDDGAWWIEPTAKAAQEYCDFWRDYKAGKPLLPQPNRSREKRICPDNTFCT